MMCKKIPADTFESIKYHITFVVTYILTAVNLIVRMSIDLTFFWTTSMDRRCLLILDLVLLLSLMIAYPKYCYSEYKRTQL